MHSQAFLQTLRLKTSDNVFCKTPLSSKSSCRCCRINNQLYMLRSKQTHISFILCYSTEIVEVVLVRAWEVLAVLEQVQEQGLDQLVMVTTLQDKLELQQKKWRPFKDYNHLVFLKTAQPKHILHATKMRSLPLTFYLNLLLKTRSPTCKMGSLTQ